MTTAQQVLQEARRFIAQGWTQGTFARDGDGAVVNRMSKDARCWCTIGAMLNAADGMPGGHFVYKDAMSKLGSAIPRGGSVTLWNDDPMTTREDVLLAFDLAIKAPPSPDA